MNFFSDMTPMSQLPPKMRSRSHFIIEPGPRGGYLLTIYRKGELPTVKVLAAYPEANRARLQLDGFLGFVRFA